MSESSNQNQRREFYRFRFFTKDWVQMDIACMDNAHHAALTIIDDNGNQVFETLPLTWESIKHIHDAVRALATFLPSIEPSWDWHLINREAVDDMVDAMIEDERMVKEIANAFGIPAELLDDKKQAQPDIPQVEVRAPLAYNQQHKEIVNESDAQHDNLSHGNARDCRRVSIYTH